MSNVLIGIIGVILFIGLALAGALFLGPRFQEATTNSTASAAIQATAQIAAAANLHYALEGYQAGERNEGLSGLLDKGYLKSMPVVPNVLGMTANSHVAPFQDNSVIQPRYAIAAFADDAKGLAVCKAINRQALGSDAVDSATAPTAPTAASGCLKYDGASFGGSFTDYIAWSRMR